MSVAEPRQNALPQKYISTLWKGAVIGGTMLVPGVSGGSMAMILGIYQELISAVSSFRKQKKSIIYAPGYLGIRGRLQPCFSQRYSPCQRLHRRVSGPLSRDGLSVYGAAGFCVGKLCMEYVRFCLGYPQCRGSKSPEYQGACHL